ncbi:MAG: hypothetical protein JNK58_03860 [Phycisphaerae bacterium]|nr:hypothetical protein [Phycisphaerae bacterium]
MSPNDRQFFSDALADWQDKPRWVEAWVAARPNSASAWLMHGAEAINRAWRERNSTIPERQQGENNQRFTSRLRQADESLARAAELDPGDATPWSWMIRSAIGLKLDDAEIERRFNEAVRRAPNHRQAHSARLQSLASKWGGSNDQVWRFVRHATAGVGPGSPLHVLVAEAHIETWFASAQHHGTVSSTFFRDPAIQRSLIAASHDAFEPEAFHPSIDSLRNRNYFAFCLWKAGLLEHAAEHFAALGNRVTQSPWCFAGDPVTAFTEARSESCTSRRAAA